MAGTFFEATKLPLPTWFRLKWEVVCKKNGASALALASEFNLNYVTVWNILQKLRKTMASPNREKLSGNVEVDKTLYGGFAEGQPGRSSFSKEVIAAAVEAKDKNKIGRMRLNLIESARGAALIGFIQKKCVRWKSYNN
jgi:hypothetical protein